MRFVDLTHSTTRKSAADVVPVVARSVDAIDRVPLEALVTLATVVDLTNRPDPAVVARADVAATGVAGIRGVILRTGWCDRRLAGLGGQAPELAIEAAAYLLEGGVRTVASDFPVTAGAADMLLHNNCVLVHCLSNLAALGAGVVRLVALPLKFEDTFSAEARVIAIVDS